MHNWNDDKFVKGIHAASVDDMHSFGSILGEKVGVRDWHSGKTAEFEAKLAVVVATDSAPVISEIDGSKEEGYWTQGEAISAGKMSEHLIVLELGR